MGSLSKKQMRDLKEPKWMLLKAGMFLAIGCIAGGLIFASAPSMQTAAMLALVVWSFCRAYYFAFYVIEKYVDPTHKFSGIFAALRFLFNRGR